MLKTLSSFDAYAKPLDDFRVKTASGAAATLLSGFIIFVLVISEFIDYSTVRMAPSLVVDTSRKEKMRINVDVTFPTIPLLSMDVMDSSGEHQVNVHHTIFKSRLDTKGQQIEKNEHKLSGNKKNQKPELPKNYCGACYGGKPPSSGCCNTCEDVEQAYQEVGWVLKTHQDIEQCVREGYDEKIKTQTFEGCNIHGYIDVNKVSGNFHFAPGKSYHQGNVHVHEFSPQKYPHVKYSHKINELSFGETVNFVNPLNNVEKSSNSTFYNYQYFIKVVGTRVVYRNGKKVQTNQFSVTENEKDVTPANPFSAPDGVPGVYFSYDISPMLVILKEEKKPFAHFLTDICAIIGGIFTVAGLVDGFIWNAEKALKKKMELGKAN